MYTLLEQLQIVEKKDGHNQINFIKLIVYTIISFIVLPIIAMISSFFIGVLSVSYTLGKTTISSLQRFLENLSQDGWGWLIAAIIIVGMITVTLTYWAITNKWPSLD